MTEAPGMQQAAWAETFRAVFERAAVGMARVRFGDARWLEVNDAFCAMLGYSHDELLATSWTEITHPEDLELELVTWRLMGRGELDSYVVEKRFVHKAGPCVWARLTLSLVRDASGQPDYEIAVIEDITGRKLAEQEREQLLAAEREARERTERLQVLASQLSAARTPVDVGQITLGAGCQALGLGHGAVFTLREAAGEPPMLELLCTIGYDESVRQHFRRVPLNADTMAGEVALLRAPVVRGRRAEVAKHNASLRALLQQSNFSGGAVFPLLVTRAGAGAAEHLLGTVGFNFHEERELAESDVAYLGALAHICAQALDRARLYEAEQRARAAAEREQLALARLVDALPVMITTYLPPAPGGELGKLTFNRAFTQTLGWTEEDTRDTDVMVLCCPDPAIRATALAHIAHPESTWMEIPTRTKDGRSLPVLWSNLRLSETMQVGVGVDLSERKAAEAAVEAERLLVSAILDQMPVGVSIAEAPSGRLYYINPTGQRLLGHGIIATEDVAALERYRAIHDDGSPYAPEEYPTARALAGETVDQHPMRYVRGDGRVVDLAVSGAPVYDAAGGLVRAVVTWLDVSERVALEQELLRAKLAAEGANRAKSEFLAAMSHELRTPLNAIGGYVDLLELGIHGPVSEAQAQALERIRLNGQHLLSLINDILQFARLEAGRLELEMVPLNAARTLAELEPLIQPQVQRKGLDCVFEPFQPDLACLGDAGRVRQIALNLIGNAIKFTDPGGSIRVWCEREGDRIAFRVSDTGHGIPEEQLERIFDPFVQLERNRVESSQQGVGLGLPISRDLARSMHGDITVSSVPGAGSTFSLLLSLAE